MTLLLPILLEESRGVDCHTDKNQGSKFLMEGYYVILVEEEVGCWLISCLFCLEILKI